MRARVCVLVMRGTGTCGNCGGAEGKNHAKVFRHLVMGKELVRATKTLCQLVTDCRKYSEAIERTRLSLRPGLSSHRFGQKKAEQH